METKYIPEFIALAEYGSSYVAAEKLFVSQSSLLRHVQAIEDEFGMPLFERNRKGFILNKAGQVFLPYARQIVSLRDHCYDVLHREESDRSTVRVCAEGKIVELMIDFRKAYLDRFIEYCKVPSAEEALYEGKVDVAFLTNLTPRHADSFQTIRFAKEEVLLLAYEDHPLARLERVSMEQLRDERFVVLADDLVIDERFYRRVGGGDSRPMIVASVPTGSDLIRMVRERIGVALIHGRSGMVPPAEGLRVLPLDPPIEYEMNIYFRKDVPLSAAAETFVGFARRWIARHGELNLSLIE